MIDNSMYYGKALRAKQRVDKIAAAKYYKDYNSLATKEAKIVCLAAALEEAEEELISRGAPDPTRNYKIELLYAVGAVVLAAGLVILIINLF